MNISNQTAFNATEANIPIVTVTKLVDLSKFIIDSS